MELMQLKYFKTVAEIGKISEAAQSLFISAPALSTSISRLEKELGLQLFQRASNRIELNVQGQIFLRYVNQVFATLDCAKAELRQSMMLQGQHVSIASVASTQWVDMITAFTQDHPHFMLSCATVKRPELQNSGLPAQYSFLLASEEDVPPYFSNELDHILLFKDHPVIMVHPDHPLAKKRSVELTELLGQTLFLPMRGYPLYDHLVQLFAASGIPFPAGNAYSHLATQQMAANGLGVAFASVHTLRTPSLPLCYVPISDPCGSWASYLYWRKNRALTEDEKIFRDFVIRYYQAGSSA